MNYLTNAINTLTPWWDTITILCYVLGIALFFMAGYSAINANKERNSSQYIWLFLSAVLCLNLPPLLDSISVSIFNNASAENILSYSSDAANAADYITFSLRAVMLIGLLGVIRGINFLRDTPQRAKDMPKAITHMIGGTLAVNIVQFLQALGSTAGSDIQSYIEFIL